LYVRSVDISLNPVSLAKIIDIPFEPYPKFPKPKDSGPSLAELDDWFGDEAWKPEWTSFPVHLLKVSFRMLALMIMGCFLFNGTQIYS
jgi:hypothetical protein